MGAAKRSRILGSMLEVEVKQEHGPTQSVSHGVPIADCVICIIAFSLLSSPLSVMKGSSHLNVPVPSVCIVHWPLEYIFVCSNAWRVYGHFVN